MRITQPGQARAYPFDRNPIITHNFSYVSAAGPHGATTRWTYTVPANRKAVLLSGQVDVLRITAAAPVGQYGISIGPGSVTTAAHRIASLDNAVGARITNEIGGQGIYANAADVIKSDTLDLSTGGTVDYHSTGDILEFDA